jgi:predicted transcriptional regulator
MSSYIRTGWETGFFQSPNCIFDVEDLSINEKMCYLYLCRLADGEMKSFPSYATIGIKMSVSKSTAVRSVKSLEQKGYIRVERRKKSKNQNLSNIYTLIHPDQVGGYSHTDNTPIVTETTPIVTDTIPSVTVTTNKYSFKNTQLKKDIYTDSGHAEKKEFQFYDWVNNK